MADCQHLIHNCLYFTANSLARDINRMAEEAFAVTGLSPSHAFLMMLVIDTPGIHQKALAEQLHLAPSTVTRFVDKLVYRGLLERQSEGKAVRVSATDRGRELGDAISAAWKSLYHMYSDILGEEGGRDLTRRIDAACDRLQTVRLPHDHTDKP